MDERIKGEYRKIYSELTMLIMYAMAGSLLIKFFLLNMGMKECATEFIVLVGSPLYLFARQLMLGLDGTEGVTKKTGGVKVLVGLLFGVLGFLLAVYFKHGKAESWAWEYILTFVALFVFTYYISGKIKQYFAERKGRKYED